MSNRRAAWPRHGLGVVVVTLAGCSAEAGMADGEGAMRAALVGERHDAEARDAAVDARGTPRERVVREVTGDEASAIAAEPVADREACHEAWMRLEAARDASERKGDPYPVLGAAGDAASPVTWALHADTAGRAVDVVPSAFEELAVECATDAASGCAPSTCDVPVAWVALDVALGIAIDPVLKRTTQVVGSGQHRSGSDSTGGIQVRYAPVSPEDPFDVLIAWFLDKPRLDDASFAAMRAAVRLPSNQPVLSMPLVDQGAAPAGAGQTVLAIQTSAQEDGSDAPYWGIFGPRLRATYAAHGLDNSLLRFGSASHAPTPAKAVASAKPVALYALTPWAPGATSPPACGGITEVDPARRCDGILESQVGALVDATLARGRDLFARIVWQETTYGGVYVTRARVTPEGDVTALHTVRITDFAEVGLPPADVLAGL